MAAEALQGLDLADGRDGHLRQGAEKGAVIYPVGMGAGRGDSW